MKYLKNTQFNVTIAEFTETAGESSINPFLTKIKFIFTDNKENGNKQGIKEDEFDNVALSAVNMPIKMNYDGENIDGHAASTPIGHIINMTKEVNGEVAQLVGEALLYREEYPKEVQFLKDQFTQAQAGVGETPGVSWEIAYHDSVLENGVEWLKQAITMAATFVRMPAYGRRTQLLAIAQSKTDDTEFMTELKDIVDSWTLSNKAQGGNKVEEELEKAKAALLELQAKLDAEAQKAQDLETQLTQANEKISTLETENAEFKVEKTLAERVGKIAEAGVEFNLEGDALTAKQAFWLSLSEENFEVYVEDLKAIAPKKTAAALTPRKESLPKFTAVAGQETTLEDLKASARRASRGDLVNLE